MDGLYVKGLRIKDGFSKDAGYVFELPVIRHIQRIGELVFNSPVVFFVGENGAGKSTLLEAMAVACGFNAEGGSRNFNFSTAKTHSELHRYLTVIRGVKRPKDGFFLRAESFYNVATEVDALDLPDFYGGKSLHRQSHGESVLSLVLNRFGAKGLYMLDEPESALSPSRQMSLLSAMHSLVRTGSQFIVATHSPILLAYPGASIFVIDEDGIRITPYEQTEHYTLTREFLNHPGRMLKHLLED